MEKWYLAQHTGAAPCSPGTADMVGRRWPLTRAWLGSWSPPSLFTSPILELNNIAPGSLNWFLVCWGVLYWAGYGVIGYCLRWDAIRAVCVGSGGEWFNCLFLLPWLAWSSFSVWHLYSLHRFAPLLDRQHGLGEQRMQCITVALVQGLPQQQPDAGHRKVSAGIPECRLSSVISLVLIFN